MSVATSLFLDELQHLTVYQAKLQYYTVLYCERLKLRKELQVEVEGIFWDAGGIVDVAE